MLKLILTQGGERIVTSRSKLSDQHHGHDVILEETNNGKNIKKKTVQKTQIRQKRGLRSRFNEDSLITKLFQEQRLWLEELNKLCLRKKIHLTYRAFARRLIDFQNIFSTFPALPAVTRSFPLPA